LRSEGKFRKANMGTSNESWNDEKIRGDELLWVNNPEQYKETCPNLYHILLKLDELRVELNLACGLNSPEKTQVNFLNLIFLSEIDTNCMLSW
jgi:hypothetical protein